MPLTSNSIIKVGGAHQDEKKGYIGGQRGDQTGKEVSYSNYTEAQYRKTFGDFKIYRVKDASLTPVMCQYMITACDNPNIGYDQAQGVRTLIFDYGPNTTTPIACDCSSLVCAALSAAVGKRYNYHTSGMIDNFPGTGLFMNAMSFQSFESTPVFNGDILLRSGHTEMVVGGNPREGNEDEITGGTFSGNATEIAEYRNISADIKTSFTLRTKMPETREAVYNQYYLTSNGVSANGQYAWARFSEIYGGECDLSRGVPRTWFSHTEDKYERGTAPSLGAVMCYTNILNSQHPGLVSIVEEINGEIIRVSQKSLSDPSKFEYVKRTQKDGSWDLDLDKDGYNEFLFQGFIYNPTVKVGTTMSCKLQDFVNLAKEQVGRDSSFTRQHSGYRDQNNSWSAAFIVAVASKVGGILGTVIPEVYSCSTIGSRGVARNMGTWLDGPTLGGRPNPHLGDIAFIRVINYQGGSKYKADRAGIVVEVGSNNAQVDANNKTVSFPFKIVIGDWEGRVSLKEFSSISGSFSGLYRPNWNQIDGVSEIYQQSTSILGLYTQGTTLEDAAIRDSIYFKPTDTGFEPSIQQTGITACAINYTGLLSDMYSILIEAYSSNASNAGPIVDVWSKTALSKLTPAYYPVQPSSGSVISSTDGTVLTSSELGINGDGSVTVTGYYYGKPRTATMTMSPTAKEIYALLYQQVQNRAGVIGIMANMFQESKWNPGAINSSDGGSGLIQWTNVGRSKRRDQMANFCLSYGTGQPFANNLSGQIAYLFHEAATNSQYGKGLELIKKVSDSEDGAVQATRLFLDYFEIGMGNVGKQIEIENFNLRSAWAKGAWQLFFGGKV